MASSRWRGMGTREAESYRSERTDFMRAADEEADKRTSFKGQLRTAGKAFGLELIGQVFKGFGKAGQKDLFNQAVTNAGNRAYSMNQVLEQINPMQAYMTTFEAQKDAISKDGGEIGIRNPMDKIDYTAHFLTRAGLNEAKNMDTLRAILAGRDASGVPKTDDMRLIDIQDYMAKADPRIQEDAKRMINKYEKDLGYFGNLTDPQTNVLLTSKNVQDRIKHITGLLKTQTTSATLDGQLISISKLDGWLYKLGITDGNVMSNIINDVQNEDIGNGLKRRLSFNISDSVADEDFEIMVDTLLTGWNQIQKDFTAEQKEELREANAILNKPKDNSNKDVAEAGKTVDQTVDTSIVAGNGFSFRDASKDIGFKTDLVPLTEAQQKQRILDGLDALMEAEAVYLADQTPEGRITYRDATTKILKTVGRYRIQEAFAAGATDDLNNMKLRVIKVLATGTTYKDLDEGDRQLYNAFFTTSGSKVTAPKNLPYSLGPTQEIKLANSGLNILEGLRYNSSGDSKRFVNERVSVLINKGWLSEANREQKESQLLDFIQANPTAATTAGSVIDHMIKALKNDDPSISSFGSAYSSAMNNYVLAGEQDLGDMKAKALTDVLAMSYTQSETGGLFNLRSFDKMYQATGIANTKGIGKGSDWAILLGTDILYDKEKADVKNSKVISSYTGLAEGQQLAIDRISRQFINWENGDGEFSSKYTGPPENKKPSVNQITNMIERYDYLYATARELGNVSPDIAERLNPFIRTSEDMTNFGRQEFNAAYDYLRDSVYSELAFYNVALNKEATHVFDNVISTEGLVYPSDTPKEEVGVDTQMAALDLEEVVVTAQKREVEIPDTEKSRRQLRQERRQERRDARGWEDKATIAAYTLMSLHPANKIREWAVKKAGPPVMARTYLSIGNAMLKGKNAASIKGKIDSLIFKNDKLFNLAQKNMPKWKVKNPNSTEGKARLAVLRRKWIEKQKKKQIKGLNPNVRKNVIQENKWYKGLSEKDKLIVNEILKNPKYTYGGKTTVTAEELGRAWLLQRFSREAVTEAVKKYGPGMATTAGLMSLLERRRRSRNEEEEEEEIVE
jgi:hypothetical protein